MKNSTLIAALVLCGLATHRDADAGMIPYPDTGTVAPTVKITGTGTEIYAYFGGSSASFYEQVGMYVNGTLTSAGFVFPNHNTATGTKVDLGFAAAGADVVFAIQVYDTTLGNSPSGYSILPNSHYTGTPSYTLYSVPTDTGVNSSGAYSFSNSDGSNHAYITDYLANQITGIGVNLHFPKLFTAVA